MRLGELTYLTDQIVTFGFSSLELRNKAGQRWKNEEYTRRRRSFSRRSTMKKTAYTIPRQTEVVLPRTSL